MFWRCVNRLQINITQWPTFLYDDGQYVLITGFMITADINCV